MEYTVRQVDNKFLVVGEDGTEVSSHRSLETAERVAEYKSKIKPRKTKACKVSYIVPELPVITSHNQSNQAGKVPQKDPLFVPFGVYADLQQIIASRLFFPVFITGPTGNGKSSTVEQVCAELGCALIRVQITKDTDEGVLLGTKTLVDGNISIVEGPVIKAMREGSVLLLDEISVGTPDSMMCLQSVLEGKPLYFTLKNEVVCPAPGFNIIATDNTKGQGSLNGKYIGTKFQNEAFLERFGVTLEQNYPSRAIELKILKKFANVRGIDNNELLECLASWSELLRKTHDAGAIDEVITTRRLIQILTLYTIFSKKKKIESIISMACSRFNDNVKEAFITSFKKLAPESLSSQTIVKETENETNT